MCVGVVNPAVTGVATAVVANVVACVVAAAAVAVVDDVTVVAGGLLPNNPPVVPTEHYELKSKVILREVGPYDENYQCVCVVEPVSFSHSIVMVCSCYPTPRPIKMVCIELHGTV